MPAPSAIFTSLYSYLGERIDGTATDPWPALASKPAWLVDCHAPWETVASGEPENNFVLSQAVVSAGHFLEDFVADAMAKPRSNVFTIEIQSLSGRQVVVIDRLGSTLAYKWGGRVPALSSPSRTDTAATTAAYEHKHQRVRTHAGREPKALIAALQSMKADACRNLPVSGELALAAYALLLEELRLSPNKSLLRLFEQRDPAAFHVADLIQEALFLGAGIFSTDTAGVGRMASFLGIGHRTR